MRGGGFAGGWSPNGSPKGMNPPFLIDGYLDGPRVGPRIFADKQAPHEGGSFILYQLTGLTLDAAGLPLPGCTVMLFETATNIFLQSTVSDGLGAYAFLVSAPGVQYYIVAYKAGALDVYGTTINTITGLSL